MSTISTGSNSDATGSPAPEAVGTVVCPLERIEVEGGVAALVDGEAVAVFRTFDDQVFAISNYDPYSKASVLSRGIVGSRAIDGNDVPFVASPMHKQPFDLRTGRCLDDEAVGVPTYPVRVIDGVVVVGRRRESGGT
ncbi:nitrite reductase small subunit NirD [Nocardioides sp. GY 10113]|uniref:nitrite reductase small subunit NirD n=1 Tax=Nocardioides sp. GY 10113 TaxID=2569761 RepID=UPI0010A79181|nr:nitrite reductase small subunit NirD [Nocardioides sp. GY 10113]TIC89080.1 nitrite reductase small subunit NirD [Nocardioides sp. GY 10113]